MTRPIEFQFYYKRNEIILKIAMNKISKIIFIFLKLSGLGRVRILIKTRLKINFDRFTMEKMSNFIFNQVLISIRTRPKWHSILYSFFRFVMIHVNSFSRLFLIEILLMEFFIAISIS